ncbi:MAG: response regulator transcription factor [Planctomycetaceae bacterium]|nr:response regulator transcription factor [Planctomycetaceae bacterium]
MNSGGSWLIVETQAAVREALALALTSQSQYEIVAVSDLGDLRQHLSQRAFTGVLISFSPQLGRWDQLNAIVTTWNVRAVLLDEQLNELNLHQALLANWYGYLSKEQSLTEIAQALRDVAEGTRVLSPAARQRIVMTAQGPRLRLDRPTSVLGRISKRELEVLLLVAQGYSVRETADLLGVKASTVENHKTRMMRKLHVHKSVDLTRIALQEGLLTQSSHLPRSTVASSTMASEERGPSCETSTNVSTFEVPPA